MADAGKIAQMPGVTAAFEEPKSPDLVLQTDRISVDESVSRIVELMKSRGYMPSVRSGSWDHSSSMIRARGPTGPDIACEDLGDGVEGGIEADVAGVEMGERGESRCRAGSRLRDLPGLQPQRDLVTVLEVDGDGPAVRVRVVRRRAAIAPALAKAIKCAVCRWDFARMAGMPTRQMTSSPARAV